MPSIRGGACAAAVAVLLAAPAMANAKSPAPCHGAYTPAAQLTPASAQRATLCLINRFRNAHHLRSVHTVASLTGAATAFASEMVTYGFFSHTGPDGKDLTTRLTDSGFVSGPNCAVGEDLAWGVGDDARPADIVHIWKTSATHRENLLDPTFDSIGIGVDAGVPMASAATAALVDGGATYVADFGSRGGA